MVRERGWRAGEKGGREGGGRKGEREWKEGEWKERGRMENKAREREEAHHPPWPVFSSPPVASVSDSEAVLPPVVCMMSIGDSYKLWPEQTCTCVYINTVRQTGSDVFNIHVHVHVHCTSRQAGRQAGRQVGRRVGRQAGRQVGRQAGR